MDTKRVMTEALEDLVDEELKQFIRQLCNGVKPDIEPISQAMFQTSEREDVVDCMVQQYPDDAGEIAVQALRNMKQYVLAQRLELKLQEGIKIVLLSAACAGGREKFSSVYAAFEGGSEKCSSVYGAAGHPV
ncbi:hypothetical protein Q8A67_005317 [Cirrhinus molitorella]|uniref:Pyrin domain-containing protein n=1 Tax=Cirrhinus molitorella TaxID=172907 RepID=A0AA88TTW6_9TELE|nr:hypothetical protein Q8A67_005317 [Cirrhinus molitorella]